MQLLRPLQRLIEKLPPYPALIILAVPLAIVEPLKLAALSVAGTGHWISGTVAMLCAYTLSLTVVHWLFKVVKPKLFRIPWFRIFWRWVTCRVNEVRSWFLGKQRRS